MNPQVDSAFRPLVKAAIRDGWTLDARRRHTALVKGTTIITLPSRAGTGSTLAIVRGQLRKAGVRI